MPQFAGSRAAGVAFDAGDLHFASKQTLAGIAAPSDVRDGDENRPSAGADGQRVCSK